MAEANNMAADVGDDYTDLSWIFELEVTLV